MKLKTSQTRQRVDDADKYSLPICIDLYYII